MSLTADITNISRCSLHDGPGVRTVIYFKGRPLRCRWCHNPETLSPHREILFAASKCIQCGRCRAVCPSHHVLQDGSIIFIRQCCTACGRCVAVCPVGALSVCAEPKTVDEVMAECHSHGISTAIESAMFVPWQAVKAVIPHVDQFFTDLKIADPVKHQAYTGQRNERITSNIRRLSEYVTDRVTIRIPMIPSVNDSEADLHQFGRLISTFGNGINAVELLRYNHLAESKYLIWQIL